MTELRHEFEVSAILKAGLIASVLLVLIIEMIPARMCRADPTAVSVDLTGWGWCLAYRDVGNVTANLTGTMIPRSEAPEVADLYLTGTLRFNLDERTDSFDMELRGTKVRSLFFLKQVTGGGSPLIAEFEGTWLDESGYVACEGRLAVPVANHVARPYVFVLRTRDVDVPPGVPGNYVSNFEAVIRKGTLAFDTLADRLAEFGDHFKKLVGDVLTEVAVLFREVRTLGTPYFT